MGVEKQVKHVPGRRSGEVFGYFLSTCGWCKKTRGLLDSLGVEYSYLYVDLLEGEDEREAVEELKRWNPKATFPTIVIDRSRAIVGHDEDSLREALANGERPH
jgi:glutaredoxin